MNSLAHLKESRPLQHTLTGRPSAPTLGNLADAPFPADSDGPPATETYLSHVVRIVPTPGGMWRAIITPPGGAAWPPEVRFHLRENARLDAFATIDRHLEDEAREAERQVLIHGSNERDERTPDEREAHQAAVDEASREHQEAVERSAGGTNCESDS